MEVDRDVNQMILIGQEKKREKKTALINLPPLRIGSLTILVGSPFSYRRYEVLILDLDRNILRCQVFGESF